jgi:hypothetical protein
MRKKERQNSRNGKRRLTNRRTLATRNIYGTESGTKKRNRSAMARPIIVEKSGRNSGLSIASHLIKNVKSEGRNYPAPSLYRSSLS